MVTKPKEEGKKEKTVSRIEFKRAQQGQDSVPGILTKNGHFSPADVLTVLLRNSSQ